MFVKYPCNNLGTTIYQDCNNAATTLYQHVVNKIVLCLPQCCKISRLVTPFCLLHDCYKYVCAFIVAYIRMCQSMYNYISYTYAVMLAIAMTYLPNL